MFRKKKNKKKKKKKKKSGIATKVKLVPEIKKDNELYFGTLNRTVIVEITHNILTSFKTLASKKATT